MEKRNVINGFKDKYDYLEETNIWKDTFCGVYNGVGENNLGKIIMKTRTYHKE
jgi:hypothetical protein